MLGGYTQPGSNYDYALLRFDADGWLDPSFGAGGIVTTDYQGKANYAYGLALQADGKFVLAGYVTGVKVQLDDKSSTAPGRVQVSVTGNNGTYPVVSGDEPINAIVTVGGQAEATAGLCGETAFVASDCFYNSSKNQLTCQK